MRSSGKGTGHAGEGVGAGKKARGRGAGTERPPTERGAPWAATLRVHEGRVSAHPSRPPSPSRRSSGSVVGPPRGVLPGRAGISAPVREARGGRELRLPLAPPPRPLPAAAARAGVAEREEERHGEEGEGGAGRRGGGRSGGRPRRLAQPTLRGPRLHSPAWSFPPHTPRDLSVLPSSPGETPVYVPNPVNSQPLLRPQRLHIPTPAPCAGEGGWTLAKHRIRFCKHLLRALQVPGTVPGAGGSETSKAGILNLTDSSRGGGPVRRARATLCNNARCWERFIGARGPGGAEEAERRRRAGYGTLVGPKEISGFVGDTVSLQCTYGEALKTHRKYWCRKIGYLIARCSGTVFSGEYGQEGRVSVHDSPWELRFKVILRNLTLEDEGQYFCGIQRLGLDDSFSVSLHVFPASPGLHLTVSTAKLGKTGAEASPSAGTFPSEHPATSPHAGASAFARTTPHPATSPHAGASAFARTTPHPATSPHAGASAFPRTTPHPATSPHAGASAFARTTPHSATSPHAGTTPHPATSPPAGISRPTTQLDSTSAKDTSLVRRSSTAKSGTSIPMTRILAPVLVLLALLLATGLAALGSWVLQRRKEGERAALTGSVFQPLESSWVPEYTAINPAGPTGPPASPNTEIRCLSQASEEDGACLRDPEGDVTPGPPLPVSGEGPGLSEFISG
uniref:CD300 molecule like family member g n=1 Tax=Sus scrofa TaxID=9823 RepID=K7GLN6_PIG